MTEGVIITNEELAILSYLQLNLRPFHAPPATISHVRTRIVVKETNCIVNVQRRFSVSATALLSRAAQTTPKKKPIAIGPTRLGWPGLALRLQRDRAACRRRWSATTQGRRHRGLPL